jgi:hypothetical protein
MQTRVCVGNRSWGVTDTDVADLAAPHGTWWSAWTATAEEYGPQFPLPLIGSWHVATRPMLPAA